MAEMSRRISLSRARRTGSPIARAASKDACAGFTTKSVKLTNSSDRMIATISVGSTVKTLHSSTSRMCRRDPAAPRRRSSQIWVMRPASIADQRHGDHQVGDQQRRSSSRACRSTAGTRPASQA